MNIAALLLLLLSGVPKITKLEIEGRGFHTNLYAVRGTYFGGKEGKSRIQWLRSMVGSPDLISIPGMPHSCVDLFSTSLASPIPNRFLLFYKKPGVGVPKVNPFRPLPPLSKRQWAGSCSPRDYPKTDLGLLES